ncbi:MAG TPA: PQQ-dependent sugar dehydrogenase [Bdellovibrionota bacterium]|nr:PQQ-dependent sugar dehydrogenase [Bdellovibrionota bacterium]
MNTAILMFLAAQLGLGPSALAAPPALTRTDFLTGLSEPWDLAFAPDGAMLFTEKCKGLSARKTDGRITRLFGIEGSALVAPDLFCEGQSGMHGVALDPDFARNRFVYLHMASKLSQPRTNRVVRLKLDPGYSIARDRLDIVTDIPFKDAGNRWGGPGLHSGGRLRFGPDGFLYVTTGDNHNGTLPQDARRLGGKVLRIDREGKAAPGNSPPAGFDPRVFTFGHRNVQGLAFRPGSGKVCIAEHGPGHSDEVTVLRAGGNGGWDPKPEPGVSCADGYCGYTSNKPDGTPTPMTDLEKFPDALKPLWNVGGDSAGMGPATFLTGAQWKDWDGRLAVGIMRTRRMAMLQLSGNDTLVGESDSGLMPRARYRSLVQGPDGSLYVATDEGAIWKVTPR